METITVEAVRAEIESEGKTCPRCDSTLEVSEQLVARDVDFRQPDPAVAAPAWGPRTFDCVHYIVVTCTGGCGLQWRAKT